MDSVFFLSVVINSSGSCSMGFVIDKNLLHYPGGRFALFQKVGDMVKIACPCSVLTVTANLFHKSESRKAFNR